MGRPIPNEYVVVLDDAADPDAVGPEMAIRFAGRLRHVYRAALRGFSISLPAPAAEALARDPRVRFVEQDGVMEVSQVQAMPPWGLDRIDQRTLPLDQSYYYGFSGSQPVSVHVIDTGIRTTHYEFTGRAFIAGDYVDDDGDNDPGDIGNDDGDPTRSDGQDCNGHGTHVAGSIGGVSLGVARNVTLWSYRALACNGEGTNSAVIAAVDAVTIRPERPAIANMSLGGSPSASIDEAVRRSIASGVTYVVAAGNQSVDASLRSPARVIEAITAGATSSNDARASFSNYGPALDLFAPGVGVKSAWHTSDAATATLSGTSMAAPHVAGVAAAYLEANPESSPSQVRDALVTAATANLVAGAGSGSPNLLLYSRFLYESDPSVTLSRPDGGEKVFTGTPFNIEWAASDPDGLSSFDVYASVDDGVSYVGVPGCTGLATDVRTCTWAAPGPATSKARIRVVATDTTGAQGGDISSGAFQIASGAASIVVTGPNTAVNWGRQSTQQIKWTHNLGTNSYVRLDLSRDGGASFTETIAVVKNTSETSGTFNWIVTGPNATNAVVRVSWTDGPVSDVSNSTFIIADPFITVAAPSSSTSNWGYGTLQRVRWTTNLGALAKVAVLFSPDGTNFSTVLTSNVSASKGSADVTMPQLSTPTSAARVRVAWSNPPSGSAVVGTNPVGFRVEPAFLTLTSPNGGELWTVGKASTIRWTSNLGALESVRIELSTDQALTYAFQILSSTKDDGSQSVTPASYWVTTQGRVRVSWIRNAEVLDASNADFTVK